MLYDCMLLLLVVELTVLVISETVHSALSQEHVLLCTTTLTHLLPYHAAY